jgi:hypothetical protein
MNYGYQSVSEVFPSKFRSDTRIEGLAAIGSSGAEGAIRLVQVGHRPVGLSF